MFLLTKETQIHCIDANNSNIYLFKTLNAPVLFLNVADDIVLVQIYLRHWLSYRNTVVFSVRYWCVCSWTWYYFM